MSYLYSNCIINAGGISFYVALALLKFKLHILGKRIQNLQYFFLVIYILMRKRLNKLREFDHIYKSVNVTDASKRLFCLYSDFS